MTEIATVASQIGQRAQPISSDARLAGLVGFAGSLLRFVFTTNRSISSTNFKITALTRGDAFMRLTEAKNNAERKLASCKTLASKIRGD